MHSSAHASCRGVCFCIGKGHRVAARDFALLHVIIYPSPEYVAEVGIPASGSVVYTYSGVFDVWMWVWYLLLDNILQRAQSLVHAW